MRLDISGFFLLVGLIFDAPATGATVRQEFPFEYREGLIWVQVAVRESRAPLNFLLDSGAGISVINLATLQRIGRLRGRRYSVRGVETATTGYWPQHLSVSSDSIPLGRDFLAVDLSALSRSCKRTVDGLIGADFFLDHTVQIDFLAKKIHLAPLIMAGTNQVVLPLKVVGGALRVPVSVNHGAPQWVRLDTGCAGALHWVNAGIGPDQCRPHVSVGLALLSVPITQTSVQLGGVQFESVPTGVHRREIFPGEAGLLGNDLLSRFSSVRIDVPAERVVLEKAAQPVSAQVLMPPPIRP